MLCDEGIWVMECYCVIVLYVFIDLSYNGGLGKVIQKNVQLQNFPVNDGLAAVKHGNGRDWWVVHRKWETATLFDEFYFYLVSPDF